MESVDAAAVLARHTRGGMARDLMGDLFCGTCSQPWLGAVRTGGCEAVLLAREVVALRERAERAFRERDAARGEALAAGAETVRLSRETLARRVALLEGLLRDLAAKGEAMKAALFTGDDNREAIACMEWDDAAAAALAEGG